MKSFKSGYIDLISLLAVFLTAEVLIWPMGNFPLNDDWSYTKSVNVLVAESKIYIGDWPAMTLFTHLVWGALFVKLFGFSFFVLRLSTLVSAFIGVWFLRRLLLNLGAGRVAAFTGALTLLFNPVYLNLSNTFMTDVNFNTLFVIACYLAFRYFETSRWHYLIPVAVISVLITLLRQFGLVVPFAMLGATFFFPEKRLTRVLYVSVICGVVLVALWVFEKYNSTMIAPYAAYKYILYKASAESNSSTMSFDAIWYQFSQRWAKTVLFLFYMTLPVTLPSAVYLFKSVSRRFAVTVSVASVTVCLLIFRDVNPLIGNIIIDMTIGPDTFYQNSTVEQTEFHLAPGSSTAYTAFIAVTKYLFALPFIYCLFMLPVIIKRKMISGTLPWWLFFSFATFGYTALLFYSNSWFDRYLLPLISAGIIFIAAIPRLNVRMHIVLQILPFIIFGYAAVAGTHDYFTMNRARWQAYHQLKFEQDVPGSEIQAGIEVIRWDEGENTWWHDYNTLKKRTHLIQYEKHPEFEVIRKIPFQRWFPMKTDTLLVQKRISE